MKFQIPEHITWKNLDNGIVLLDLNGSNYYTLNETASFIWQAIKNGKDENEISAQIMLDYECTTEECVSDIREQIAYLLKEGLIEKKVKINGSKKRR